MTDPSTRTRTGQTATEEAEETDQEQNAEREANLCPECSGRLVSDEEHGETVCSNCGLVVEEEGIDRGPEWRAFGASERDDKSRVGAPTTKMMNDKGLSTKIGWKNSDASGKTLSASQRKKMQRLRKWDERFRTRDSKGRNLKQALAEIDRMASSLGLPEDIRETASVIYRRALDEDHIRGRSIEGVTTSCVYAAARLADNPRSLDRTAQVSRIDRLELARTYRYICGELNLEVKPADPTSYVPRFVSDLSLSVETERRGRELLENTNENAFSGKSPVGLAAAAVYAAALLTNEKVTQREVSEVADISKVTIRNRYKELLEPEDATLF